MKRFLTVFLASMTLVLTVSGCDFLRRMAGRPTSDQIEAKRQKLASQRGEHQARMDSLAVVQQAFADSVAKEDEKKKTVSSDVVPGETVEDMKTKFAVTLGAFSSYSEAKKLCDRAREAGYDARLIRRGKYISVAAALTDSRADAIAVQNKVKKESFYYASAIVEK